MPRPRFALFLAIVLLLEGLIPAGAAPVVISKGTLIRLELQESLSTRTSRIGQMVSFRAVEDLRLGKTLVIAKNAFAQAQIEKVRTPGRWGRNGSLKLHYLFVKTTRDKQLPIMLGERSIKTNQSLGLAAGASMGGFIILGPLGLISGNFVKGRHVDLPQGTQLMVEVTTDTVF